MYKHIDNPTPEEPFINGLNRKSTSAKKKGRMTEEPIQTPQNFTFQLAESMQRHEEQFDEFLHFMEKQKKELKEKNTQKNKSLQPLKCFTET